MTQDLLDRLVVPFYLDMMRFNALDCRPEVFDALLTTGRTTQPDEVLALLQPEWRELVMGAWFALFHDDEQITAAVLRELRGSAGSLTSPPLATVAVTLAGTDALSALEAYTKHDQEQEFGACGFTAAAIEHLGGRTTSCVPTDDDRVALTGMLRLASELRGAR